MIDYIIIGIIVLISIYIIYRFIKKRGSTCSDCSSCQECIYHKEGKCDFEDVDKNKKDS